MLSLVWAFSIWSSLEVAARPKRALCRDTTGTCCCVSSLGARRSTVAHELAAAAPVSLTASGGNGDMNPTPRTERRLNDGRGGGSSLVSAAGKRPPAESNEEGSSPREETKAPIRFGGVFGRLLNSVRPSLAGRYFTVVVASVL